MASAYFFGGLVGVSLAVAAFSGYLAFQGVGARRYAPSPSSVEVSRRNAIVAATEKVAPAVVSITATRTEIVSESPFFSPFMQDWFERYFGIYKRKYSSLGSGVIIDPRGYVLTNEHVVHEAETIKVTLSDGTTMDGRILGGAPDYDLALVEIEGNDLPYAELGDSDDLMVGEWVIAIGSPLGYLLNDTQPTVTVGVISAYHRDVKSDPRTNTIYKDMIQTDAAINPGNSGGPLVNTLGQVIGINTFILTTSQGGGNIGMGFAIPINRGKWVLDELLTFGRVRQVWTGLSATEMTPRYALSLGMNPHKARGLLIYRVAEGSPADQAGLKPGDIILAVNGQEVRSVRQANRIIFGSRVGDKLELTILRKGKRKKVELVLEEEPSGI